ncbi:hypothetical protein SELMODRAFT_430228 [Selaginella moellendorffii]|uniref:Uncharacterized protein n=1 Tax=Selaginella moellendorffii TaxID=88036 RepID=D8T8S2_SELML|nr:hypothetical protein SELMODRAFT_430228 [Selaginella moellendorffii]
MQHSKFHAPSPRQLPAASSTDELQQEADSERYIIHPVADEEYVPDKEEITLYVDDGISWDSEQLEVVIARGPFSPDRVVNVEEKPGEIHFSLHVQKHTIARYGNLEIKYGFRAAAC